MKSEFGETPAFVPRDGLLDRVTIAPLTAPISDTPLQAAVFRIAPGASIRRHPTSVPQILAVIEGAGDVAGGDGAFDLIAAAKRCSGRRERSTRLARWTG